MQYTEDDLRDALYAGDVDGEKALEETTGRRRTITDRQAVRIYEASFTNFDLTEQADLRTFDQEVVPEGLIRYQRGKEILTTCKVIASRRSTVLGSNDYDDMVRGETVVSPVIVMPAGYIATSEASFYCALAIRKGKESSPNA